ncbi:hypothetical protein [Amycolatopsis sp. cmx-8-4]|uniref:hypothetical protein n=1 Tax=Amycolatopsis sp. cmx-8-4 TaxID=2790947 RepID=UPI0039780FCA
MAGSAAGLVVFGGEFVEDVERVFAFDVGNGDRPVWRGLQVDLREDRFHEECSGDVVAVVVDVAGTGEQVERAGE